MNHKIFTIYDSKAKAYLTPFFLHEDAMAVRVFADCINDTEHQFGRHPEDYTLFNIGKWSDDKAKLIPNNPISLGCGIEFVILEAQQDAMANIRQEQLFTEPQIDESRFGSKKGNAL